MDRFGLTRRDLLKVAALALPASAALPGLAFAAEPPDPAKGAGTPKKVIVVGAGLAGLAAAYELAQLGHEVTVLEAQTRAGGRVYTLRSPFADGLYAEAGTISYSEHCRHMFRYIGAFGLATTPLSPRGNLVYHLRGRRLSLKPRQKPDWPYDLGLMEQGQTILQLMSKYLAPVEKVGNPADPGWRPEPFLDWDKMTLEAWLESRGASKEAVDLLRHSVWWGHGWSEVSAFNRLISDVALFLMRTKVHTIQGGTDLLTQAFAKTLRDRILYGAPAVRLEQTAAGVRVTFRQQGAEQTWAADRAICAVPAPLVRKITFEPALPAAKRQIVAELEYTPVTRIYLQTRRRPWEEADERGGAGTDLPIGLVAEQPIVRAADAGPRGILECHMKGADAERASALDEAARLAFAIQELEKVHPGIRSQVEGGTSHAWHLEPWVGGGYPLWKPGQITKWMPELAKAEDRIHFAGEHTSWLSRTAEGALESGNRAAREVHEAG